MPAIRPSLVLFFLASVVPFAQASPRPGAIELRSDPTPTHDAALQQELGEGPAWRDFQARHGTWTALWNEGTRSPHLAFGPAILLRGFQNDAASVDRAVRGFIRENEALFGRPTLETVSVQRAGDVWYLVYRQTVRGTPVLFEDWVFCVGASGGLMTFRADAHRIDLAGAPSATIDASTARAAAHQGLSFDVSRDRATGGDGVFLLPYAVGARTEYRAVREVQLETAEPRGYWRTLVDARTGEVLWRHDELREVVSGHVSGLVHLTSPFEPTAERPFARENVTVGGATVSTDAAGAYSAAASGVVSVSSALSGPFLRVVNGSGTAASFSGNAADGTTLDIRWGPDRTPPFTASIDDERDAFYHINLAHDFLRTLDPNFTNDGQATANVNAGGSCGAFTFGSTMIFLSAGACPAAGTFPDILYHEYGHVVNDRFYLQVSGNPMMNGAMHEATADLLAAFIRDDPGIAVGLVGPGVPLRTLAGDAHWPEYESPDLHTTGLILAQSFWDLRQSAGLALATRLYHFAQYGVPDDLFDDGLAMSEYFIQTLVADDNDGNLANGTPHLSQINAAFNAHGIGSNYFISIAHAPLVDQSSSGPFPVTATIRFTGPSWLGRLDLNSPTLEYSIDGGAYVATRMMPMAAPDQFTASIPAAPASAIHYFIQASDNGGGSRVEPAGSPVRANLFLAGTQTNVLVYDMEKNQGWSGDSHDTATKGKWVRAEPNGTTFAGFLVQTDTDHTPGAGTDCWVTGNSPTQSDDVDGGKTTLFSPIFSAAGIAHPVIEYYRWFMNAGRNLDEFWRTDISNDGGNTWVSVENTNLSRPAWDRVVFAVAGVVPPTSNMRMRFIAEDRPDISAIIEAALDDFRLISMSTGGLSTPELAATEAAPLPALQLGPTSPNPFRGATRMSYAIPRRAPVDLRIYDVGGRLVRRLVNRTEDAGAHAIAWDGTNEEHRPASSGLYYARLTVEGMALSRRIVLLP